MSEVTGPISNLGEAAVNLREAAESFEETMRNLPATLNQLERIVGNLRATVADARYIVDRVMRPTVQGEAHVDPGSTAIHGD